MFCRVSFLLIWRERFDSFPPYGNQGLQIHFFKIYETPIQFKPGCEQWELSDVSDVWRSKQSRFEGHLSETENFVAREKHLSTSGSFCSTSNGAYRYKKPFCFKFYWFSSTKSVLEFLACFRCGLIIYDHEISSDIFVDLCLPGTVRL